MRDVSGAEQVTLLPPATSVHRLPLSRHYPRDAIPHPGAHQVPPDRPGTRKST